MIYVRIFICQIRSVTPSFCTRSAPVKLSRQNATGATAPAAGCTRGSDIPVHISPSAKNDENVHLTVGREKDPH